MYITVTMTSAVLVGLRCSAYTYYIYVPDSLQAVCNKSIDDISTPDMAGVVEPWPKHVPRGTHGWLEIQKLFYPTSKCVSSRDRYNT